MKNYLEEVSAKVKIEEGEQALENILLEVFFNEGTSTKELARKTLLPVPLAAAVKKEFIKAGVLAQDRGVRLTPEGKRFIEKGLGFEGLNHSLYQRILNDLYDIDTELKHEKQTLGRIFEGRPQVDVTIDQSKCTPETSLKRAALCLQNHSLIGKTILCVGDDDLVSMSLAFLARRLFPGSKISKVSIHVVDVDERFLNYIREIARIEGLPIECHHADLRNPLPEALLGKCDCFFTDPPYTMQGMSLFMSRGISGLKKKIGLPAFLSFAHKTPDFTLRMQTEFLRMGLMISDVKPRFNEYEGAEIIGNTGQMTVLKTTSQTKPSIEGSFEGAMYTGEVKKTLRTYKCKKCGTQVKVGFQGEFTTIEELKKNGCPQCKNESLDFVDKVVVVEE